MNNRILTFRPALIILLISLAFSGAFGQKKKHHKKKKPQPAGRAVMWEPVEIERRDLFNGPGGVAMRPDVSKVEFIEQEKGGHNKKYKIRDADGKEWVAKLGREAKPETVATRLLWALGYKTEINYLVPKIKIPTKGTFSDVRLEARPNKYKRLDEWKWKHNPFVGTNELAGLKMMMVFFANWDVLDLQNKIVQVSPNEYDYIISDLGSTFGSLGNNNLPIFYRFGRSTGKPNDYIKGKFVKGSKKGLMILAYKGKNRDLFRNITTAQGRWLADLLNRLSEDQIRDAFRAARYSEKDIDTYTKAVKNRIVELNLAAGESNLAIR